jgi:hypothetical protein
VIQDAVESIKYGFSLPGFVRKFRSSLRILHYRRILRKADPMTVVQEIALISRQVQLSAPNPKSVRKES